MMMMMMRRVVCIIIVMFVVVERKRCDEPNKIGERCTSEIELTFHIERNVKEYSKLGYKKTLL